MVREESIQKIKEIEKLINGREDVIGEFDEELFVQMVEKARMVSLGLRRD